ncbi:P-loop containing nucleoside triphosphate hydrolase protein [Blyttiomyces helicus]|uniref:P-loop containing nucleoside triphosphate hydrolase protein n=1 Tax=Blyttiomyces helicus TaxID=388810 RepID=A0A4P9WI97_9FUNG|nr:P-loop containing nucleoside triphosphate hydrolase protein [Blyttiomyces helicus]|eukprot:RKO92589.1 P-loop containing nucleoside triphosphate hydrolase protein [Blyttiomyces helicus]
MINVDAPTIAGYVRLTNFLWSCPVQLVVSVSLLVHLIGNGTWAGLGIILGLFATQSVVMPNVIKSQVAVMKGGDARLKAVRELFQGIRIVKLRAWENVFLEKITALRNVQLKALESYYSSVSISAALTALGPVFMPMVAFVVYSKTGGFQVANIFASLVLFGMLQSPLLGIPGSLRAMVSWKRIVSFLYAEEIGPIEIATNHATSDKNVSAIAIRNGAFAWPGSLVPPPKSEGKKKGKKDETAVKADTEKKDVEVPIVEDPVLFKDLNLTVKKGSLTAIVGTVGAGKSSLFSALTGGMTHVSGEVTIASPLALCEQQPWILTDTVQANILFGRPMDETRLHSVVKSCSLAEDVESFPNGLATQIGEKGINLSGGQRARVAIARAAYDGADIVLLDDPLAALDAHVGKRVYEECIKTALRDKTVVLITHQLHLLRDVDDIIVLEKGGVVETGSFDDLRGASGTFAHMLKDHVFDERSEGDGEVEAATDVVADGPGKKISEGTDIIVAEEKETGAVKWSTIKTYIEFAGGSKIVIVALVVLFLQVVAVELAQFWISWWTSEQFDESLNWYLGIYIGLTIFSAAFLLLYTWIVIKCTMRIAVGMHRSALEGILRAPMSFFDSQPIGRILNRFSADIGFIDEDLWGTTWTFSGTIMEVIGQMIAISIISVYMIALFVPLAVIYYFVLNFYRASNRELKRLSSTARSPLYAHISESLSGVPSIRAYSAQERFIHRQLELIDRSNSPEYLQLAALSWVQLRAEAFGSVVILVMSLIFTGSSVSPSLAGLALINAISSTILLNLILVNAAAFEANLNSVERLKVYCFDLPQEPAVITPADPPASEWPSGGEISFENLEVRYSSRPDHAVIRDLSLKISKGEKVGIVGRTGSGKSTLLLALFRLLDPHSGRIIIDGEDITRIGTRALRSRIQIIPQEPVLFTGTIRSNLDPEGAYADDDIWRVLEMIGLKQYVSDLKDKLDSEVSENGSNLSVGQRQLLCLGRAVIVRPRIIVMDEATASVDGEADRTIQACLKTHFKDATILCIAHRLNTIADFDRVLVLDDGELAEIDAPEALLSRPDSLFCKLAEATGPANAALIREIAASR